MGAEKLLLVSAIILMSMGTVALLAASPGGLDRATRSTVVVLCGRGYGTGWWVTGEHVVTAAHVVSSCGSPLVLRGSYRSNATIVYYNASLDVAVLRVAKRPPWGAPTLEIADRAYVGEQVWAVGYPVQLYEELSHNITLMSMSPRASAGEIAWINPVTKRLEITCPTDKGNSGGPVVDQSGAVVGIVSYARTGTVDNPVYAVSIAGLRQALDAAGIRYGVHHWWEGRAVLALLLAMITPLLYIAVSSRR